MILHYQPPQPLPPLPPVALDLNALTCYSGFPLCLTISLARTKEMSSYLHLMMEDDGDDSEVLEE